MVEAILETSHWMLESS